MTMHTEAYCPTLARVDRIKMIRALTEQEAQQRGKDHAARLDGKPGGFSIDVCADGTRSIFYLVGEPFQVGQAPFNRRTC